MEIVRFYVNGEPSTVAEEALSPDVRKKLLPEATSLDFKKVPVVDDEGNYVLDYVSNDEHPVIPITHADLVSLLEVDPETGKQSAQLISGQKFRIIDYRCAVNSDIEYARALTDEEHGGPRDPIPYLDIVVTTETMYEPYWDEEQEQYVVVPHITLSEDAAAVDSQYPLFVDSMKSAVAGAFPDVYNVKYSLYNDDSYEWSVEDGTGVITWMQDRKGNEAPYDFVQIVFRRYPIVSTVLDTAYHSIDGFACGSNEFITVDETVPYWMHTFSFFDRHGPIGDSVGRNNKVFEYIHNDKHVLNDVVILEDDVDTRDPVSNHNIRGQHITCNGKTYDSEITGKDITLDTYSDHTKIDSGGVCLISGRGNQLQGSSRVCIDGYRNVLESCYDIRFAGDDNCLTSCSDVQAGSHFDRNTLNRCAEVHFLADGTDLTSLQDGFRDNVLEHGCSYLKLVCADSSSSNPVQYYTILSGFAGRNNLGSISYLTYNCTKALASRTFLGLNSSKVAKEINVLDLAP